MFALGSSVVLDDVALTVSEPAAVSASQMPNQCGPLDVSRLPSMRGTPVICGPRFLKTSSGTSDASPYSREPYVFTPLDVELPNTRSESSLSPAIVDAVCDDTSNLPGMTGSGRNVPSDVLDTGFVFHVTPASVHASLVTNAPPCSTFAPMISGIRRTVAPAGAEATPERSNRRYPSRLLSLVALVSCLTARSGAVPKFVPANVPLRTVASATGVSPLYVWI